MEGEIAALSAAALWAVASVLYGFVGVTIPPLLLNLIKGIIAIALLIITILLLGDGFPTIPSQPLMLILLSGVVGIGLGDTFFFAAINSLGARRTLLIGTLAPPLTAILAQFFLNEQLLFSAWWGIILTIAGVAWVVTERTSDRTVPNSTTNSTTNSTQLLQGLGWAILTATTNSIGSILARAAFNQAAATNNAISPLWAALLRLSAGVLSLLPLLLTILRKQKNPFFQGTITTRLLLATTSAAFCGTFLGIWLQQTAIKLTSTAIAQTLLQTSPIFILPLAVFTGKKISLRAIAGVLVAIAGIALLFYLNQP